MKHIPLLRCLSAVLLGFALLFACVKPEPEKEPEKEKPVETPTDPSVTLALSVEKLAFSSLGGAMKVDVTTNQASWTTEVDVSWISVTTTGSSSATVTAQENTETKDRQGTVSFIAGGKKVAVSVKQDAATGTPSGNGNAKVSFSLREGTLVAPKAFVTYVKAHDAAAGTLTLDKDIPKELIPVPGTDLVINTPSTVLPNGLLARIGEIEEKSDGLLVYYGALSFTSVFKDLDLDTDELDLNEYVTRIEDAEGNELSYSKTRAATQRKFHIDLPQIGWDLPMGFSLTPKMGLDMALKLQMIVGDYKISTLNFKVDMDATIGADLELMLEGSVEKHFKIISLYFAAIPVGPVLLTPAVDIYGFVGADGKIGLSASASTVLHTSADLHYDEINGLSGNSSTRDPEPEETQYFAGPKIEAGFHYGLGVGPSLGVFGDLIQVGMTVNLKRRESLSVGFDLISLFNAAENQGSTWGYQNPDYTINWEVNTALHLRGLGIAEDYSIPGFGLKEEKYKLFPPVNDIRLLQDGGGFVASAVVTGPSLLSGYTGATAGEIALRLEKVGQVLGAKVASFNLSEAKALALWDEPGSTQTIQAHIDGLEAGAEYRATLCWKYGNDYLPLYGGYYVVALDNNTLQAIRGILSDIKSCADGDWKGCNWDERDLTVESSREHDLSKSGSAYRNVRITAFGAGSLGLEIELPEEWKLGDVLTVDNHCGDINNLAWSLSLARGQDFDTISISDVGFAAMGAQRSVSFEGIRTKVFVCHSPKVTQWWPEATEKLDLSGTGIDYLGSSVPSIVIVDNCPNLQTIILGSGVDNTIDTFSAKNCPALKGLALYDDINISAAAIEDMVKTVGAAGGAMELTLWLNSSRMLDELTLGKGVSRIRELKNVRTLTLSGASDLEYAIIRNAVSNLSVSDCPKLEELSAPGAGLESFSIDGLPALRAINVEDNEKLGPSLVPAVFDRIRKAGGWLHYDERYEYKGARDNDPTSSYVDSQGKLWKRYVWKQDDDYELYFWYHDTGHGFYYSGEPERSYHTGQKYRNDM